MSLFYDFKLKRQKKPSAATSAGRRTTTTASSSSSERESTSSAEPAHDISSPAMQLVPKQSNKTAPAASSRQSTNKAKQENIVHSEDSGKCSPEMSGGSGGTTSVVHSPASKNKSENTSDEEHARDAGGRSVNVQHTTLKSSSTPGKQPVSALGVPPNTNNSAVNCAGASSSSSSLLTCFGSKNGAPNKTAMKKIDELVFPSAEQQMSSRSTNNNAPQTVVNGAFLTDNNIFSNNNNNNQPKPQPSDFSIKNVLLQSQQNIVNNNTDGSESSKLLYLTQPPILSSGAVASPVLATTPQQQPTPMFNLNQLLALAAVQQQQQQQQLVNGSAPIILPQHLLQPLMISSSATMTTSTTTLTVQQQLVALQNALQNATLQQQQQQQQQQAQQQTQQQLIQAALLSQQQQQQQNQPLSVQTSGANMMINSGAPEQGNSFVGSILYKALLYGRQAQQQQISAGLPPKLQSTPVLMSNNNVLSAPRLQQQQQQQLLPSMQQQQHQQVATSLSHGFIPVSSAAAANRSATQFVTTSISANSSGGVGGPSRMLHPTTDINIYDSRAPSSTPTLPSTTQQPIANHTVSAAPTVHLNHQIMMNGGSLNNNSGMSATNGFDPQQQFVRTQQPQNGASSAVCPTGEDFDVDDPPMVCMICSDIATGLHYGIITCEGCKGFFKRTVQNKRIYTCVGDGKCEITKTQRNRCQYCRFEKCRRQGMVIAAVREDRMPGGRNSGAVYNMYKVKYRRRKHNKAGKGAAQHNLHGNSSVEHQNGSFFEHKQPSLARSSTHSSLPTPNDPPQQQQQYFFPPSSSSAAAASSAATATLQLLEQQQRHFAAMQQQQQNNNKSAMILSAPPMLQLQPKIEPMQQPHTQQQSLSLASSAVAAFPFRALATNTHKREMTSNSCANKNATEQLKREEGENIVPMDEEDDNDVLVKRLIELDQLEDVATLKNMPKFFDDASGDLTARLRTMGDSMVFKLVQWTRTLPMLADLPAEQVTALLENKWHVILLITTSVYRAMYKPLSLANRKSSDSPPDSPQRNGGVAQQRQAADSTSAANKSASSSSAATQNSASPSQQQRQQPRPALLHSESHRGGGLPSPPLSTDSSSHGSDGFIPHQAGSPRSASAPVFSGASSSTSTNASSSSAPRTAEVIRQEQLQLKSRTVDEEFNDALEHLRTHLSRLLQKSLTTEELVRDIGGVLRQLVMLVHALRQLDLTNEEYVVLKVLLMLQDVAGPTQAASMGARTEDCAADAAGGGAPAAAQLRAAYQRYLHCFMAIAERKHGSGGGQRAQLLFGLIPYVQNAASLLLQHKMFYVPFLLNS